MSERVVFDCNVFFQAIISPGGPAGRLFALAVVRRVDLFVSEYVLTELRELTSEPKVGAKYRLTAEILDEFFEMLAMAAVLVETVPSVFAFPRDPDDAHYVDLAVAAGAKLIVSRDKDLLSLTDGATPEGRDFQTRFPDLAILTPSELLALLGESPPAR
ncbi:MAG TPA: putative toxin-antitoxin system toxin component, PIN family [Lacipirellulaceae bacterium]|nr:putative toxin-antitoxin system toxin component, PIN family [Lacipirellulaceae bacterium]HMP08629.1 putative toxin-antitoxin system toxin component, PIN family [Lacipirellulaceae bacterium]